MNNDWQVEWLVCRYAKQKSFYKKARVETKYESGIKIVELWSYSTNVARVVEYMDGEKELQVFGWYSNTTAKHINEFLQQMGYERMNKKQMEKGGY